MLSNKKGDISWPYLAVIIIIIISGVVLFYTTKSFGGIISKTTDEKACEGWVSARQMKIEGVQVAKSVGDYACITDIMNIDEEDKNKVYDIIAKEMYDCWIMYGRGKIDFYSDWDWLFGDTHCRVCDKINFNKPFEFNTDEFENFLNKESPPYHNISYSEIFSEAENAKLDFGGGSISLNKDDYLFTIFSIEKSGNVFSKDILLKRPFYNAGSGVVIGSVVGGVIGFFVPVPGATFAGISLGAKVGFILGDAKTIVEIAGKKSYFYPGLILTYKADLTEQGCDDYYINIRDKKERKNE